MVHGSFTDNINYRELRTIDTHITDELEADLGLQMNVHYPATNWQYRATGPAWNIRGTH